MQVHKADTLIRRRCCFWAILCRDREKCADRPIPGLTSAWAKSFGGWPNVEPCPVIGAGLWRPPPFYLGIKSGAVDAIEMSAGSRSASMAAAVIESFT